MAKRMNISQPYQPPIPWREIAQPTIDKAEKLRRAFQEILERGDGKCVAELIPDALNAYRREFGHEVDPRTIRRMLSEIRTRDGGRCEWHRLELYLPKRIIQKKAAKFAKPDEDFSEIDDFLPGNRSDATLTWQEEERLWKKVFECHARMVADGVESSRAERQIRKYLFTLMPFRHLSEEALRRRFERWQVRVSEHKAGNQDALLDGRECNTGNHDNFALTKQDKLVYVRTAALKYEGRGAPAFRDCMTVPYFVPDTVAHYNKYRRQPSRIPKELAKYGELIEMVHLLDQNKRHFNARKGWIQGLYDFPSLICITADDFTFPVYFYVPDGNGWFEVMRGQCLLFGDFRTGCILHFALIPERNYTAHSIWSACTKTFKGLGDDGKGRVPFFLKFELATWKRARLLKGGAFSANEICQGFEDRFGIIFSHARRPQAKGTIERAGGQIQDHMADVLAFASRDERKACPERVLKAIAAVKAQHVHPQEHFLSFHQWNQRLFEIVNDYNARPQHGEKLEGLSPIEGVRQFLDPNNPLPEFGPQYRFLLDHDPRKVKVTLDGFNFTQGKERFKYRGASIADWIGQWVTSWVDPDQPDVAVVTDLDWNHETAVFVERANPVSALEAYTNPDGGILSRELQKVDEQANYVKTIYNDIKLNFPLPSRPMIPDEKIVQLGRTIESGKEKLRAARTKRNADDPVVSRFLEEELADRLKELPEASPLDFL